jgi:hypothetical protein
MDDKASNDPMDDKATNDPMDDKATNDPMAAANHPRACRQGWLTSAGKPHLEEPSILLIEDRTIASSACPSRGVICVDARKSIWDESSSPVAAIGVESTASSSKQVGFAPSVEDDCFAAEVVDSPRRLLTDGTRDDGTFSVCSSPSALPPLCSRGGLKGVVSVSGFFASYPRRLFPEEPHNHAENRDKDSSRM